MAKTNCVQNKCTLFVNRVCKDKPICVFQLELISNFPRVQPSVSGSPPCRWSLAVLMLNTPLDWVTLWRLHMLLEEVLPGKAVTTSILLCPHPVSCLQLRVTVHNSEYNYLSRLQISHPSFALDKWWHPGPSTGWYCPRTSMLHTLSWTEQSGFCDSQHITPSLKSSNVWSNPDFSKSSFCSLGIKICQVWKSCSAGKWISL